MASLDTINDTWFDEFNSIFTGCLSLIFNVSLIIATSQVKIYSDHVKRMQIFAAILRLFFSVLIIFCSPTLAYIIEAEAVYIVKGGFQLPIKFGQAILISFVTFVIFSCMGPPMQFLQVVFIVKKNPRTQKQIVFITTIISFIVSFNATLLISFGYSPDASDDKLSEEIVYNLNGRGKCAYLIASLERFDYTLNHFVPDPISWACTLYILAVLVITTIISLVCWIIIKQEIHKGSKSSNSMKATQQLNTVLIVQFTLPFLTIHIPFYVSFLMPLFRVETSRLSIYLPYLFSWCPALNPILVMIMVKTIRDQTRFRINKRSTNNNHSSATAAANMFTKSSNK
ncbi:CRE-SRM-1 protein [Caenorhabditis remanei]|uniref:CRE-SRM-1 protein n=1 Tax=Caenorhabditis remanei TaxID=31234 RepID=E3MR81_CAERE|nr:CRE-SRM-1 protein [Caenorhabditis remanei]